MANNNSKTQVKAVNTVPTEVPNVQADRSAEAAAAFAAFVAQYGNAVVASAIAATDATLASDASALAKTQNAAEITRLESEIAEFKAQIEPLNAEIKTRYIRMAQLKGGKSIKGDGTRTRSVTDCPECNQGRHADNEKTKACKTYEKYRIVKDAALLAKSPVPSFASFITATAQ